MKNVLIVSPVYNEEKSLTLFVRAISDLRNEMKDEFSFRLLLVNDGSRDKTLSIIKQLHSQEPDFVQFISFAGNAGYQSALTAGLSAIDAWSDVVITMDSDLEHPVSLIPKMLQTWIVEEPLIVNTRRSESKNLPYLKRLLSKGFYRTTALLTGIEIYPGMADFRLWDARLVRAVKPHLDRVGSVRVFAAWLKVKKCDLEYCQNVIEGRKSRFGFRQNFAFWKGGIIRFSNLPFRLTVLIGSIGVIFSVTYALYILFIAFQGIAVPGWTSLILVIIFMGCLNLVSVGVLAAYLSALVFSKDLPNKIILEKSSQ